MTKLGTGLLTLALAVLPARAQEPWDHSFTLFGGTASGAKDAHLGQDRSAGLSVEGVYPLTRRGFIVFQGGYRYVPTTTVSAPSSELEFKTDAFFGSIAFRRELFFDGFYLQGGLRGTQARSSLRERVDSASVSNEKGLRTTQFAPIVGAGFRFTEKLGVDVNFSSFSAKNHKGAEQRVSTLDVGLVIHLGK